MSFVVGVDPGLGGALCFLDEITQAIHLHDTPVRQLDVHHYEADGGAVLTLLNRYNPRLVCIELVQGFGGVSSAFKLGQAYGAVICAAYAGRFRLHRVRPQTWQTAIFPVGCDADTKAASRAWCLARYDRDHFVRGKGKKPDHNRCDATCIAHFASKTYPEAIEIATDRTRKGER